MTDKKPALPKIKWDDTNMRSTYANVCNVASTREEMTLLFGTNQAWHTGQKEMTINLSDRIVLNPYAAKRMLLLLQNVVNTYEKRFGELKVEGGHARTSEQLINRGNRGGKGRACRERQCNPLAAVVGGQ